MTAKNHMLINGKDVDNPDARLTINLADDFKEVRGFGKPITRPRARQMAKDYLKDIEAAQFIVNEIKNKDEFIKLRKLPQFQKLQDLINPETQTVSGVFGKEIILQILSMRNCEGIRYIIGKDQGKNTVILIGVQEENSGSGDEENSKALSSPVKLRSSSAQDMAIDAEVHESSLNLIAVQQMLGSSEAVPLDEDIADESKIDILFGTY